MTPGNHPISVSSKLIKNSVPNPCFRNTANGGSKRHKMIVNNDIVLCLLMI